MGTAQNTVMSILGRFERRSKASEAGSYSSQDEVIQLGCKLRARGIGLNEWLIQQAEESLADQSRAFRRQVFRELRAIHRKPLGIDTLM